MGVLSGVLSNRVPSLEITETPLGVSSGGTGASSLTDHGVLVGSGTGAVTPLAVGTTGQVLVGATGADPAWAGDLRFVSTNAVGLGVTPKTWDSLYKVLQVNETGYLAARSTQVFLGENAYFDDVNDRWEYITASEASQYVSSGGTHVFNVAASGAADGVITWIKGLSVEGDGSSNLNDHVLYGSAASGGNTTFQPSSHATKGNFLFVGQANGQTAAISTVTESTPIAAAASTDTAIDIPAGALILAVSVRVTTAIPDITNFTVTGATSGTTFNTAAVSGAATSTDKGTAAGAYYNSAAQKVRITPNTSPSGATGVVRVTIHYIDITPATS